MDAIKSVHYLFFVWGLSLSGCPWTRLRLLRCLLDTPVLFFIPLLRIREYIQDLLHGLFTADVIEWSLANQKLISEHPKTPQIDSIVIFGSSQDLRWSIIESPTISFPSFITNCSPTKITKLTDALNNNIFTWVITIFSGLISRWAIWFSCRYLTAEAISLILTATSGSGSFLFFFKWLKRVPSSMYSRTR